MLGALALLGASAATKSGLDWVKGKINNSAYADRIRDQADLQYVFAERYAKNSPSWNVEGLRRAGLNPVLAVSNGVNLGSNVPNLSVSSPDTDSGNAPDLSGVYQQAQRLDIDRDNAVTSRLGADAQMIQAKAAASRSAADVENTRADTALKLLEAEKLRKSNLSHPLSRDVETVLKQTVDNFKDNVQPFDDYINDLRNSYLEHSPSNPYRVPKTPVSTKQSDVRERESSRVLDSVWKTRRRFDGKPVYRRRGDVGGIVPLYR